MQLVLLPCLMLRGFGSAVSFCVHVGAFLCSPGHGLRGISPPECHLLSLLALQSKELEKKVSSEHYNKAVLHIHMGLFLLNAIIDWTKYPCRIIPASVIGNVLCLCNCYFFKQRHTSNVNFILTVDALWGT